MADHDLLDVVDEDGTIIDTASRKEVHEKGLLHREVHIWLVTDAGEIIFQHRSVSKETSPNLLDASIGGHIDSGMSWVDTAIKEAEEEAGVKCTEKDLVFIQQVHANVYHSATGLTNNCLRRTYALPFTRQVSDLKVEKGEATHFEAWPIEKLLNLSEYDKKRFIPVLISDDYLQIFKKIATLAG